MLLVTNPVRLPDRPLHLRLHSWQRTTIDDRWNYRLEHPFWRLYRNHDAGAELYSADNDMNMVPGRLYLIPSLCAVSGRCRGPVWHEYCHFSLVGLPLRHCPVWHRGPVLLRDDPGRLALWDQGFAADPAIGHLSIQSCLLLSLQEAIQALPVAQRQDFLAWQCSDDALAAVCTAIDEGLAGDLSVAALAQLTGWSPDHFARRFAARTGQTPAAWVRERRCARAAELLLGTDDGIGAIAEQVGFSNRYHFTQVFTRLIGLPPAAFRRTGQPHQGS